MVNGDSGLTGRKLLLIPMAAMQDMVEEPFLESCTQVDRSASYAARYVSKILWQQVWPIDEIPLSYAIGVAEPTSIMVDTFGTGKLSDHELIEIIQKHFDLRPAGIIKMLDLRKPIYKKTAAYGHFGRNDLDLPWERLNKVEDLKKYCK